MKIKDSGEQIDVRYAQRFPDRAVWLRRATPAERVRLFPGPKEGYARCVAICRHLPSHQPQPFFCRSGDVQDLPEEVAGQIYVHALIGYFEGDILECSVTEVRAANT
ncbi:hypothetical protein [Frigidibacter sp. MR17.24]|uniref:hypothetical protein n=1 Tax=Frigidibacter sp. MR17.24 TaxID=3127345 RepID=UPI003013021A